MEKLKIPCIPCNSVLWDIIEPYLKDWGYEASHSYDGRWETYPILVIDHCDYFGYYCNVSSSAIVNYNRKLVYNVDEFLSIAATLKGFTYIKKEDMKKEFTKSDLKPGMVVEYQNGAKRLVLEVNGDLFLSGESFVTTEAFDKFYNDNLENIKDKDKTIVKVFKIRTSLNIDNIFNDYFLKLIWQKEKIQISMDEIAAKFNLPVESISIIK